MHKEGKIAVIGDKDSVLAFRAIGIEAFCINNVYEIKDVIKRLAASGYLVIYITEPLAEKVSDVIAKYKTRTYPAIIPIPAGSGATGFGMKGLKEDVERAIGADILFNKEDK